MRGCLSPPTTERGTARPSVPTTSSRPNRRSGRPWWRRSPSGPGATGSTSWSPRSSSTSTSSSGWGSPPTSSARRCTTSRTKAAGVSRCGPRAPRRSCGRSCSTGLRCRGRSGTSRRTSATNGPRRGATASTGRSGPRCWGWTTPTSTSRSSPSPTASTATSGWTRSRSSSTRWATSAAVPPTWRCCARTCSTTPPRWVMTSGNGWRPTRCGCSTPSATTGRTSSSARRSSPST